LNDENLARSIFTLQDASVHRAPEPPGITMLIFGLAICTAPCTSLRPLSRAARSILSLRCTSEKRTQKRLITQRG
jgi:hypothetical protein